MSAISGRTQCDIVAIKPSLLNLRLFLKPQALSDIPQYIHIWENHFTTVELGISLLVPGFMVHYYHLMTHWLSLRYSALFYWPTCYPYETLLSSTGPLAVSMVHYYLLLAHWLSMWYTIIFYLFNGPPNGTLLSSTGPLAISTIPYHLLLAHWLTLWYTIIFY